METLKQNKKEAWGLVEILIAMAIYAGAIIAITSLNSKNYYIIRENELADRANKLMLVASEYFKSPAQEVQEIYLNTTNLPSEDSTNSFILKGASRVINTKEAGVVANQWETISNQYGLPLHCTIDSPTAVTFRRDDGSIDPFFICLRVDVKKGKNGYQITSKISYKRKSSSELTHNDLISYRPFTYIDPLKESI